MNKERWVKEYNKALTKRIKGIGLDRVEKFVLDHFAKYAKDYDLNITINTNNVLEIEEMEELYQDKINSSIHEDLTHINKGDTCQGH